MQVPASPKASKQVDLNLLFVNSLRGSRERKNFHEKNSRTLKKYRRLSCRLSCRRRKHGNLKTRNCFR
ncbi:hypothetical protein ACROYT_G018079 [Oculina patagonica]